MRLGAARAGEAGAGLGEAALRVEGHVGARAAELLHERPLPLGHLLDQHGDAARRDQHAQRGGELGGGKLRLRRLLVAARQQALVAQQPLHQARLRAGALELAQHGFAHLVGQLLAAHLDEQRGHEVASVTAARPSPTTSRYSPATARARSRTRAMWAVRSVTLMTPRASRRLKVWLHLST